MQIVRLDQRGNFIHERVSDEALAVFLSGDLSEIDGFIATAGDRCDDCEAPLDVNLDCTNGCTAKAEHYVGAAAQDVDAAYYDPELERLLRDRPLSLCL